LKFISSPSLPSKVSNFVVGLLEFSGTRRILAITLAIGILPVPKSSDVRPPSLDSNGPDFGQTGRNLARERPNPWRFGWNSAIMARFWPESGNNRRILAVVVKFRFSPLVSFFYESNARKYFWKIIFSINNFIENILRRKSFYIETNEAQVSCQNKIRINWSYTFRVGSFDFIFFRWLIWHC